MDTLQSLISLLSEFQESVSARNGDISHLTRQIRDTLTKFYIYGEKDEIKLCAVLREAFDDRNSRELEQAINELAALVKNRIRQELQLPQL